MEELDIIINDVIIVEGTGKKPYSGNIGIKKDKITSLGKEAADSKKIINGRGLTVLPGFIDAHSHFDQTILWYPDCENGVMQGITTFVGGQCGHSMAPLGEYVSIPVLMNDRLIEVEKYKYRPNRRLYTIDEINKWMDELYGWTINWKTMGNFLKRVESEGIGMNYAPLVGHATIRTKVMGLDYKREATSNELAEMRELIEEAMIDGCLGMSAGLDYDPDVFASNDEIIDGVNVLKKYNGVYCPHWKKTGRREGIKAGARQSEPIQGILDSIKVHKETGVRLHFAHIRSGWNINPSPPEDFSEFNAKKTIETIVDEAKTDLDITWDVIPSMIKGGFTWIGPYLASLLEPWLRVFGSRKELAKWLHSSDLREEIKEVVFSGKWGWVIYCNPNFNPKWSDSIFITKSKNKNIENKTLAEIARDRDNDPIETMFDLIEEDPETMMYPDTSGGASKTFKLNLFLEHSRGSIGLDTWAIDDKYMAPNPPYTRRGINSYNAFPLFYKKYVVEEKQLTLDQAVQKTSKSAAEVHNLKGRGTIKVGNYADLVLMDLNKLEIIATPIEPRTYATGIEHVLINGVPVVEQGIHTGKRSGQIIKNPNITKK